MVGTIKHRVWRAVGISSVPFVVYNIYKRYHKSMLRKCKCNIKIFADDTLIYVSGDGSEELQNKMNRAFRTIEQ